MRKVLFASVTLVVTAGVAAALEDLDYHHINDGTVALGITADTMASIDGLHLYDIDDLSVAVSALTMDATATDGLYMLESDLLTQLGASDGDHFFGDLLTDDIMTLSFKDENGSMFTTPFTIDGDSGMAEIAFSIGTDGLMTDTVGAEAAPVILVGAESYMLKGSVTSEHGELALTVAMGESGGDLGLINSGSGTDYAPFLTAAMDADGLLLKSMNGVGLMTVASYGVGVQGNGQTEVTPGVAFFAIS